MSYGILVVLMISLASLCLIGAAIATLRHVFS